jgi:hypothetical protein
LVDAKEVIINTIYLRIRNLRMCLCTCVWPDMSRFGGKERGGVTETLRGQL